MAIPGAFLWQAPDVNPINKKARAIPFLNPFNQYGRVFFFSWFGFFIAFWSWYAFPPLLADVIAGDLGMTTPQVLNSNIIGLVATLIVRLVAGPACDLIGPRYTFAATLLIGAIPTFLSGTAYSVNQLYAVRFFIGILGGSFVPCQVWTTGFYDKNIIGSANAITAGLGNAGGGVTYFVMPAVYYSLKSRGLSSDQAWRVSFVVPGILIVVVALGLLLLCPDTPTGHWKNRNQAAENALREHGVTGVVVDVPGTVTEDVKKDSESNSDRGIADEEKKLDQTRGTFGDHEVVMGEQQMIETARGEVIQKPSFKEVMSVVASPQTLVLAFCYFCTFGAELSVNAILGNYYKAKFSNIIGPQTQGDWAAMFGLLNVIFRPLGGALSDVAYKYTGSLWSKKLLIHTYCIITGAILVALGVANPNGLYTVVLVIGLCLGFFLEGANGLIFSLVPHVHPYANGVVSGVTGACGNLGGIIFSIIFRFNLTPKGTADFPRGFWIIGAIIMAVNVALVWIRPIPKGQIGGH